MTRIVVRPHPVELGVNRDDYERLRDDLVLEGHDVTLEPREEVEYRGGLPELLPGGVAEIAIYVWFAKEVGDRLRDVALDELEAAVRRRLRGRFGRSRVSKRVTIYGSREEVLRRVAIPEADDEEEQPRP